MNSSDSIRLSIGSFQERFDKLTGEHEIGCDQNEAIDDLAAKIRSFILTASVRSTNPMIAEGRNCGEMLNRLRCMRSKRRIGRYGN